LSIHSALRNKIPLAEEATSGNLPPQQKAVREGNRPSNGARRTEMPDIKIVTEVAGRVCALPIEVGANVGDGDDIAFVEAMKMEIPVASPAAGTLKSILVSLDDVVAEGQILAILET
jgi:biotin carboxyl carrier protein